MGTILTDLFSGTAASDLTSHTSDSGATWASFSDNPGGSLKLDGSGGIYPVTTGNTEVVVLASATFSGLVTLTADLRWVTEIANCFCGLAVSDGAGNAYYLQPLPSGIAGGGFNLERSPISTGAGTQLDSHTGAALTAGLTYNFTLTYDPSNGAMTYSVKQGGSTIWSGSHTDANFNCNRVGFRLNLSNGTSAGASTGMHWQNISAVVAGTLSITSPSFVYAGSTGNTITLAGSSTSWTSGTPGTPTFGVSTGTATSQTISSGTAATVQYDAPAGSAAEVFTDPSTGASATLPVLIPMSDSNIVFSPGNWHLPGDGSAWSPNNGSYIKVGLTVPSSGLVAQYLSTGTLGSNALYIKGVVGFKAPTTANIQGQSSQSFASSLSSGTYQFQSWYAGQTVGVNSWAANPPACSLVTEGIYAPGATTTAPTTFSGKCLVLGDSRVMGYDMLGSGGGAAQQDGSFLHAILAGEALDLEVGISAYSGQGWTVGNGAGVPALFTPGDDTHSTWNKLAAGVSRSFAGLTHVWVLNMGGNDYINGASSAAIQASVAGLLAALRAAIPAGCKIFVVPSYEGHCESDVHAGFNTYQSATPDALAFYFSLGLTTLEKASIDYTQSGNAATLWSFDGVHPSQAMHGLIATRLVQGIQSAIGGGGGGTTTGGYSSY